MGDISLNFNRSEFECSCGCGFNTVDAELILLLECLRKNYNDIILVNSGCRCEAFNDSIGGAKGSYHRLGRAADITVKGVSPADVYDFISVRNKGRYGVGKYDSFTHFDTRSGVAARWDYSTKKQ